MRGCEPSDGLLPGGGVGEPADGLLPGGGVGPEVLDFNKALPYNTRFTVLLKFGRGGERLLLLKSNSVKDFKLVQFVGIGPVNWLDRSMI